MSYLDATGIYCDVIVRKRFFTNNSGDPGSIRMKFHMVTGAQIERCRENFGQPRSMAAKMALEKTELFVRHTQRILIYQQLICVKFGSGIRGRRSASANPSTNPRTDSGSFLLQASAYTAVVIVTPAAFLVRFALF